MQFPRNKAPISAIDQAHLDGLNATANTLLRVGTAASQLASLMKDEIKRIETECCRQVHLIDGNKDRCWFSFEVKRGANYVQITKPNEVRLLSARISGVIMSANLNKPGVYNHDNAQIAQSLRRLAEVIENAPFRLADQDGALAVDG